MIVVNKTIKKNQKGKITWGMPLRKAVKECYPTEFQLKQVTTKSVKTIYNEFMNDNNNIYVVASVDGMGFDSEVREEIFNIFSMLSGKKYDTFYYRWLRG